MEQATLELYAPGNAKNLTQTQLAAMESFTKEDLKQLAEAYPNNPTRKAYLILKNKSIGKQTYSRSTWKNLYSLHKVGQTQYVAISFGSIFKKEIEKLKVAPVQDLSKSAAKAELKEAATQVLNKSAEEVAKEEGANLEDKATKPLDKMNKTELVDHFEKVTGEVAEPDMTKGQLIAAIKAKS